MRMPFDVPHIERLLAALAALIVGLFVVLSPTDAEAIDDPSLDYHTIETSHFYVHYYDGLEALARRTAVAAEESHEILSPLLDWEPAAKTHILVSDQADRANGFARVYGRNFITIYGKPPTPENNLGYYDDWLRVLVYHEYVHILHLDTNHGLSQWVNRVIGKQFHPNAVSPRWLIEGIAVYLESVRTGRGRVDSPIFKMWLRTAALDDELFSLGRASGLPFEWPSGTGPYLYGAFFVDYLVRNHGENFLRDFSHHYGRQLVPFGFNRTTHDLTGSTLDEHWDDFIEETIDDARAKKEAVEEAGRTSLDVLTDTGGRNRYPVIRPNSGGDVTYMRANLTDHPYFTALSRSGETTDEILDADRAAGPSAWDPDGETLYFSRTETEQNVYSYQDLFAYNTESEQLQRLTTGDRAREPDVHPDGTHLVHVRNRQGSMELVERSIDNPDDKQILAGRHDWPADTDGHWQQISQPVYTPDGDGVVFSWWRLDRRQRDLYRVDRHTGDIQALTDSPAHDIDPSFGPDGILYFASNVDGVFNIHAMDVDGGQIWQVSNVLRGVFHPRVSDDGRWVYVYTYTHRGFEIARFRHPGHFQHPDRRAGERSRPAIDFPEIDDGDIGEPEAYNPLPWMGPMFFTPEAGVLTGGAGLAATVSGYDPVEHHEYSVRGSLTTGPDFTDGGGGLSVRYDYSGGAVDIRTEAQLRDIPRSQNLIAGGRYVPYVERQYLAALRLAYPIISGEHRVSLSTRYRIDYTTERDRGDVELEPGDQPPVEPRLGFHNDLSFSINYANTDRYAHSISTERGIRAGTGLNLHHPALGHPESAVVFNYNFDFYQPNPWLDRHVLALRTRGALSRNASGRLRRFGIGGPTPQDVLMSTVFQDASSGFPLRGYPPGAIRGSQYQLTKLEYRFPVAEFDHGFGTAPVFIRNLKGMAFADTGTAYDGVLIDADFATGVGAELQLDVVFGYTTRNQFRLGYARGLDDELGISEWYLLFGGGF